jgi:predicted small lipoprotein YifL
MQAPSADGSGASSGRRNCLPGDVMRMFRPFIVTTLIALAVCACGNKGDLVKPMPSKLPPPTTPDSTTPQPDTTAKPAQDAGGH